MNLLTDEILVNTMFGKSVGVNIGVIFLYKVEIKLYQKVFICIAVEKKHLHFYRAHYPLTLYNSQINRRTI